MLVRWHLSHAIQLALAGSCQIANRRSGVAEQIGRTLQPHSLQVNASQDGMTGRLWTGTTRGSSALHYIIAILPDGTSWTVYDRNGTPYGLIYGNNGWNGAKLVATGDNYLIVSGKNQHPRSK
jgi:hypothetical protein